jgi:hypothetical protein
MKARPVSSPSLLQTLLEHTFLGARPASAGAVPTRGDIPGADPAPGVDPSIGDADTDVETDATDTADAGGRLELAELLGVLRDPIVWSAAQTARGWTVVIDHAPRKLATYYTHLSSLLVSAKQSITAGTPLGIIGADPLDGEHIMHLHLEVWRGGEDGRFDPQRVIETTWEYVPDPGDLPHVLVARNGATVRATAPVTWSL